MVVKTKKKITKKKVAKKAKKKVAKKKEEFSLVDIEAEMAGFGASIFGEDEPEEDVNLNAIPFSNLALQKITGGVYQGKFFEIGAQSQAGKSFILFALMGTAIHKMGGYSLLLDGERALEENYAKMQGLNIRSNKFMLAEKRTATQKKKGKRGEPIVDIDKFFQLALAFAKAIRAKDKDLSHPIVIGVDSYPMFKTSGAIAAVNSSSDASNADSWQRSAKFNVACSSYLPQFDSLGVYFVLLNQLTKRYDIKFGDPWESNNENKIKFNATQRLKGKLVGQIVTGKDAKKRRVGVKVEWTSIKNRGVMPFQKVTLSIYYNKGIDIYSGLEELLITDESIRAASKVVKDKNKKKTLKGFKVLAGDNKDKFYTTLPKLVEDNPHVLEPIWTKDLEYDDGAVEEFEAVKEDTNEEG